MFIINQHKEETMASTRISFSYPKEMKEKLSNLAKNDCRSLSSYIQIILQKHLDKVVPFENSSKKPKRQVKGKISRKKA